MKITVKVPPHTTRLPLAGQFDANGKFQFDAHEMRAGILGALRGPS